jgi:hypothetical protein
MITETGGPAFPAEEWINSDDPSAVNPIRHQGMTLRDYFAAQVAVGTMSDYWNGDRMKAPTFNDIAQDAYALADAMLKARQA